jgi:diguanylate cyclase
MSTCDHRDRRSVEGSWSVAAEALDHLRHYCLSAIPPNFRLWYCHLAGSHQELSTALNEIVRNGAPVTQEDIDSLGVRFLQQDWKGVDQLTTDIQRQLGGVVETLATALQSSTKFSNSLALAAGSLTKSADACSLQGIVSMLVASTLEAEQESRSLSARLDNSLGEIERLKRGLEEIRAESRVDSLTGLSNRKAFDERIVAMVGDATCNQHPLALIMIDIDHFKAFNDVFGHLTGDQVLKLVAQGLLQSDQASSVAARYGGEEFAVLLPKVALPSAVRIAEQIRRSVMARELKKRSTGEILGRITVSLGVAALRPGEHYEALIERADQCLYSAKRDGRNRVASEASIDGSSLARASA